MSDPDDRDLFYPGSTVYRNRFGYHDPAVLADVESTYAYGRSAELARRPIPGRFDLAHLQHLHIVLFGDVYPWAGQLRSVRTFPGDTGLEHTAPPNIPAEADRIVTELAAGDHLRGRDRDGFLGGLAEHWADLSVLHPFVDGNSRTQRVWIDQLTRHAGWALDWRTVSVPALQAARVVAFLDSGHILRDVLDPVLTTPEHLPDTTVAALARPTDLTMTQHWRRMLDHLDTDAQQPYTWPTATTSTRAPRGPAPSRPPALGTSTPRP